ncbi:MAG TPA: hypothetical protein DCO72_08230 [Ruminococcus sp.]|nr:hypothetical protein [Ruminococcus sp.]
MILDRELLQKKLQFQKVKNELVQVNGISVLEILDFDSFGWNADFLRNIGYTSSTRQPDSLMDVNANETEIFAWVRSKMQIENGAVFYLLCGQFWAEIQIINAEKAIPDLWHGSGLTCGFTLLTEDKKTLLDIGLDSRDESHYLWDRYDIS